MGRHERKGDSLVPMLVIGGISAALLYMFTRKDAAAAVSGGTTPPKTSGWDRANFKTVTATAEGASVTVPVNASLLVVPPNFTSADRQTVQVDWTTEPAPSDMKVLWRDPSMPVGAFAAVAPGTATVSGQYADADGNFAGTGKIEITVTG